MTIEVVRVVEKPLGPVASLPDRGMRKRSLAAELLISLLTSGLVHALLILALALLVIVLPGKGNGTALWLSTAFRDEDPGLEQLDLPPLEIALPVAPAARSLDTLPDPPVAEIELPPLVVAPNGEQPTGRANRAENQPLTTIVVDSRGLVPTVYRGRSGARKQSLLESGGGTAASERAVEAALTWLAQHQLADGGWSLDHRLGSCAGRCSDPGSMSDARIAPPRWRFCRFWVPVTRIKRASIARWWGAD